MGRHFRLSSELSGAIAKKVPHGNNQLLIILGGEAIEMWGPIYK